MPEYGSTGFYFYTENLLDLISKYYNNESIDIIDDIEQQAEDLIRFCKRERRRLKSDEKDVIQIPDFLRKGL